MFVVETFPSYTLPVASESYIFLITANTYQDAH